MSNARDNRRKIKVLQENNSTNQSRLVGNNGFVRINQKKIKTDDKTDLKSGPQSKENVSARGKPDPAKCESKSTCDLPKANGPNAKLDTTLIVTPVVSSSGDALVQASGSPSHSNDPINTSADEILSWMTDAKPPNGYWKELAEQRRVSLHEALVENEKITEELEVAEKEIEMLKAENELLKEDADDCQNLAKLTQELLDDVEKEEQ